MVPESYAFVMNTMLLTAFYAPLLPISLGYSLFCLFLAYWIFKWQLLRRRVVKNSLSVTLSQEMTDVLELFLPVYCIGNLIFSTILSNPGAERSFVAMDAANLANNSSLNVFWLFTEMFHRSNIYS
jgi:hypothetical protein